MAVGRASDFSMPLQAQVIDAKDVTILPGFINAHVHEGCNASNLEAWAQGGVTTARNLVNSGPRQEHFSLRDELRPQPRYARIVAAGPTATVPGGYPMVPWGAPRLLPVNSSEDARDKAEQLLDDGADVAKIMTIET